MALGVSQTSTLGTTTDFVLTRDEIIRLALRKVGGLADGETMTAGQLLDGVDTLNAILRSEDVRNKNLWAISADPSNLTLVANQFRYVTGSGVSNISTRLLELVSAAYRDERGEDHLLDILRLEDYEAIQNKTESGDPEAVYLEENSVLANKVLYVWPARTSVNTQSVVTGTDAAAYRCIRSHTADSTNHPITGANYLLYWEAGGAGAGAWATGTNYTAPQLLRYKFKRPLWDFDLATDRPDFPPACARFLIYKLAFDLADDYAISVEERRHIGGKANEAYQEVKPGVLSAHTNTTRKHGRYF